MKKIKYTTAKKIVKNAKKSIKKIIKEKGKEYISDFKEIMSNHAKYYFNLINTDSKELSPEEYQIKKQKYETTVEIIEHLKDIKYLHDFRGVNYLNLKKEIANGNSISHIIEHMYHKNTGKYNGVLFYNIPKLKVSEVQILNAVDINELKGVKVMINNPQEDIPKIIESVKSANLIYCKNIIRSIVKNQDSITNFIESEVKELNKNKGKSLHRFVNFIYNALFISKKSEYYKKFNKDKTIKFSFVKAIPMLPPDTVWHWLVNYEYCDLLDDEHVAYLVLKVLDPSVFLFNYIDSAPAFKKIIINRLNSKIFRDIIIKNIKGKRSIKKFLCLIEKMPIQEEYYESIVELVNKIQTLYVLKYGKDSDLISNKNIEITGKKINLEKIYEKASKIYNIDYNKVHSLMLFKVLQEFLKRDKKSSPSETESKIEIAAVYKLLDPGVQTLEKSANLVCSIQNEIIDIISKEIDEEFGFFKNKLHNGSDRVNTTATLLTGGIKHAVQLQLL